MTEYKVVELGALDTWDEFEGPLGRGKRFAEFELETKYMGMSSNAADPGKSAPWWHFHSQEEELYIFLSGKGQMGLNDEVVDVEAGTTVRVSPAPGARGAACPTAPSSSASS